MGCSTNEIENKDHEKAPKEIPANTKGQPKNEEIKEPVVNHPKVSAAHTLLTKIDDNKVIETKTWHEVPMDGAPKAVIILLHGLNLKPEKMNDWAKMLSFNGAYVINFALYGHTGDVNHMREVSPEIWRAQFKDVAKVAQAKALEHGVPLNFLGYSLGALVGLEWVASDNKNFFDNMVFLAPALSLYWYAEAGLKAASLLEHSFLIPSLGPEDYRMNIQGTSIAAYLSLLELKKSLEKKAYNNANVKTLIIIDKKDEMVNSEGLVNIIKKYNLNKWVLRFIDNHLADKRHLLADEAAVGKDLWTTISHMVLENFDL